MIDTSKIDNIGTKLGEAALQVLMRTCRQELAEASSDELEAVCAAMRAKAAEVVDHLLDDTRGAPWVAEAAFACAALELAHAGIAVLKQRPAATNPQEQYE
jgi:hypothetical protein